MDVLISKGLNFVDSVEFAIHNNVKVTVKWKPKNIGSLPCLMAEALKRYHR